METNWSNFLGSWHPVVLHLPIGMFAALLVFECLAWRHRGDSFVHRFRRWFSWALASAGLCAAVSGWFLGSGGDYAGSTVFWHRWLGIGFAAVLCLMGVLVHIQAPRIYRRLGLLIGMLLMVASGHFGGTLTHGEGYLARYAPSGLRSLIGGWNLQDAPPVSQGNVLAQEPSATDDESVVFAVLEARCWECHGSQKQKGRLRLDTVEGLLSVIEFRDAPNSSLFQRVALPADHPDVMPPSGELLTDDEILAMMHWIHAGAPMSRLKVVQESAHAEEAEEARSLEDIRELTGAWIGFADGKESSSLRVDFSLRESTIGAEAVQALQSIAPRIQELSFAGHQDLPDLDNLLPPLEALERLRLDRTQLTSRQIVAVLNKTPRLQYLNLHSTLADEQIAAAVIKLHDLQRLVLFNTNLSADQISELERRMPGVEISGDLALPRDPFENGGPRQVLAADASKGRIALLRQTSLDRYELIWEESVQQIHDLQVLTNGNILFQKTWTQLLEVDPQSRETVWAYDAVQKNRKKDDGPVEVHSFQRISNRTTLIAESGPARLLEVNWDGSVLLEIPLQVDRPDPHHDTRLVRKTSTGTYLVAHEADGVVREYEDSGAVIWSYAVPLFEKKAMDGRGFDAWGNQVFAAERLPNGNTLIATGNGHSLLEVNVKGEIQWHLRQDDLSGIRLAWVTTVQVLPNGNYIIGNCHAGKEQPQVIEINRDKEVVWQFHDFERFGNSLSNSFVVADSEHFR